MFMLPIEIQCLIYEFDGTYQTIYKCVLYELEFVTPYWKIYPINNTEVHDYHSPNLRIRYYRLYHQQAINLIKFNHKSFPTRTTSLACESLFDTYSKKYWKVFKNIKDYTPLYNKLIDKDGDKITNKADFLKRLTGYTSSTAYPNYKLTSN